MYYEVDKVIIDLTVTKVRKIRKCNYLPNILM